MPKLIKFIERGAFFEPFVLVLDTVRLPWVIITSHVQSDRCVNAGKLISFFFMFNDSFELRLVLRNYLAQLIVKYYQALLWFVSLNVLKRAGFRFLTQFVPEV